jgi:hypothetical protein
LKKVFVRILKKCFNFCGLCPPSGGKPLGGICRAAGAASEISVRIFSEKGSDFVQYAEPTKNRFIGDFLVE